MRLRNCRLTKSQVGDTIVEVLVVLAVLGVALATAYAIANRSLLGARQAQEHTEALQLIQEQLERLRVLAPDASPSNPSKNIFDNSKPPFCITDTASATPITYLSGDDLTDYANYPTGPTGCVLGSGSLYHLAIQYEPATDTFTISAIWDDILGHGQDQGSLVYRIHADD